MQRVGALCGGKFLFNELLGGVGRRKLGVCRYQNPVGFSKELPLAARLQLNVGVFAGRQRREVVAGNVSVYVNDSRAHPHGIRSLYRIGSGWEG